MFRRWSILLATLTGLLAASPADAQKTLRVVPQADVFTLDPTWGTTWIALIHGTMIYESLFTWDSKLQPKPEMAAAWSVSADQLVWRFTLRDRLRFHVDHVGRADQIADAATRAFFELYAFDHAVS